jgi:DNA modification methylase
MGSRAAELLEVQPTDKPEPASSGEPVFAYGQVSLYQADAIEWLRSRLEHSLHACVTDPPYGLSEYSDKEQTKLRNGNKGGIWRIPPRYDGHQRSPLPRFTTMSNHELQLLEEFFYEWAVALFPVLVPGAVVLIASNPLLSFLVSSAVHRAGFERRGEIIRLVQTLRGGDRPKGAHDDFPEVSVMPRSQWEPWVLFRKPVEGRVQDNLRKWGVGGFRRPSLEQPFGDVIKSAPTRKQERALAPHPSLKPQALMRQLVRACLPLGRGIVLDPFAGGGSTLAAAHAVGYQAVGVERNPHYVEVAKRGIPKLAAIQTEAA